MPYISPDERILFDEAIWELQKRIGTVGQLNYVLTRLLQDLDLGLKGYAYHNAVHGVLACVGHEFYRRLTAPYEEKKIDANGDVFGLGATGTVTLVDKLPPEGEKV